MKINWFLIVIFLIIAMLLAFVVDENMIRNKCERKCFPDSVQVCHSDFVGCYGGKSFDVDD